MSAAFHSSEVYSSRREIQTPKPLYRSPSIPLRQLQAVTQSWRNFVGIIYIKWFPIYLQVMGSNFAKYLLKRCHFAKVTKIHQIWSHTHCAYQIALKHLLQFRLFDTTKLQEKCFADDGCDLDPQTVFQMQYFMLPKTYTLNILIHSNFNMKVVVDFTQNFYFPDHQCDQIWRNFAHFGNILLAFSQFANRLFGV